MGFADSFGQYLCFMFITVWLFVLITIRLLRTIDDDGEIRKTATAWIEQLFKSK